MVKINVFLFCTHKKYDHIQSATFTYTSGYDGRVFLFFVRSVNNNSALYRKWVFTIAVVDFCRDRVLKDILMWGGKNRFSKLTLVSSKSSNFSEKSIF